MQANKYSQEWLEQLQLLHLGLLEEPTFEFTWDDDSPFSEHEFRQNCIFWRGPRGERIVKATGIASSHDCNLIVYLDTNKIFSFSLYSDRFRQFNSVKIFLREFDIDTKPIRSWSPDQEQLSILIEGTGSIWDAIWHWTETRQR